MPTSALIVSNRLRDIERCREGLASAGYAFRHVPDADRALEHLGANPPDCLLIDLSLAGSVALARQVRSLRPSCAVVALVPQGSRRKSIEEIRQDSDAFLPVSEMTRETLRSAVSRAFGAREARLRDMPARAHTILIIDDNPDDRELFRRALKKAGNPYSCLEAEDGASGLEAVAQGRSDCVLLDYSLPGLDGLAVLQRIRALDAFLPVLMLTGQGSESIAVDAMKAGAQNYLVKGTLNPAALDQAIVNAIGHAALERKISQQRDEIIAQKRALEESDRLKTAILDSAACMIVATAPDGEVVIFNAQAERMLGYRAGEILGGHTPLLWCDRNEIAACAAEAAGLNGASPPACFDALVHKARLSGADVRELTFRRKDGRCFPVRASATPLLGADKRIVGFLIMADDITAQRRQAEELKASEETFRKAMEEAPNGMALMDFSGNFLRANQAFCMLIGYDEAEVTRKNVLDFLAPEDVRDLSANVLRLGHGEITSWRSECRLMHRSGRAVYVLFNISQIRDADNMPKRFVVQLQDITERKEVDAVKGEFISIVSHELRTPLTSIRASLALCKDARVAALPPKVLRLLDVADQNCERLIFLVNDILDADKIASGRMSFDFQTEELGSVIAETAEAMRAYADRLKVSLKIPSVLEEIYVSADRMRLIQVLNNLISNAVKFSPEGGEVVVGVEVDEAATRITVSDRGPGIPDEFRARIFDRFAQADSTLARRKDGTGLGLYISKQLIERMKGRIGLDRRAGGGTRGWIELPHARTRPAPDLHASGNRERGRKILVIEDDHAIGTLIMEVLENEGFAVDVVHTIPEARERLRSANYAAMTLDIRLPMGNGLDFAREICGTQAGQSTGLPMIVISGTPRDRQLKFERGAGIVDWIVKPFDNRQLALSVERATGGGIAAASRH